MKRNCIRAVGALSLALLTAAAQAADTDTAAKTDKVPALEAIVVTGATDPAVPAATPYTESVISSEVVRNLSAGPSTTAQTLLGQEPSVFVYANGPLGVETSIYLRAFNSSQFSETYAGVAVNDVFNGGVTGQAENRNNVLITPNNLGAIQLYRGINNPSVNAYNSLGGTVNFNPRQPADTFGGEAGGSYGNFGSFGWHATVNTGDAGGLKQVISVEQSGSRGWINDTADYNNNLYWGATWSQGSALRLYNYFLYNVNRGAAVFNMPLPLLDQFGKNFQWPRDWTNSQIHDTNWLDVAGGVVRLSDTVTLENKVFAGRNEYLRTSFSNPLYQQSTSAPYTYLYSLEDTNGPPFHFYGYTTDVIGDTPALTIALPGNELTVGGNITHGRLHSREYWDTAEPVAQNPGVNDAWDEHDTRTLVSAYVQDVVALDGARLHITPGIKYVHAQTQDSDAVGIYYPFAGNVSDSEHFVSPTLGANYQVSEALNVFAAFGRNVKLPDISAYYGAIQVDAGGNAVVVTPQVKPEHVDDYELGARYRAGGFGAEFNAYKENFRDTFVNATSPTGLTLFQNGGSSVYQGMEAQFQQDFGNTVLPGTLTAFLNLAHNQARFTSTFVSDYINGNGVNSNQVVAGTPLAGVPENLFSTGATWKFDGWRVNAEGRFIGRQYIDQRYSGTPSATVIGGHAVINVGASKVLVVGGPGSIQTLKLGLNLDNILDRRYLNTAYTDTDATGSNFVRGIYAAPRTVTGSFALGF